MNNNDADCPVCNGTTRTPLKESMRQYVNVLSSYDDKTDTIQCNNCGGREMYGKATGRVNLDQDSNPCCHQFREYKIGRCLYKHKCIACSYEFEIDSSD